MPEDRQDHIWNEIKRRAQEDVRFGSMVVELKIQDGKIMAGEIQDIKIKLG